MQTIGTFNNKIIILILMTELLFRRWFHLALPRVLAWTTRNLAIRLVVRKKSLIFVFKEVCLKIWQNICYSFEFMFVFFAVKMSVKNCIISTDSLLRTDANQVDASASGSVFDCYGIHSSAV
jgi:hypothetical protein